jgi:phosphoribosylanthranilate isomerase
MLRVELHSFDALQPERPVIKICGIRQPDHAVMAVAQGAGMLGLVFAPSRRQVSRDIAKEISSAVRGTGTVALLVGIFVNEEPRRVREIADYAGLDVVQLSGDESHSDIIECARFRPVLKAVRFPAGTTREDALRVARQYRALGLDGRLRLLVDTYHPGEYGGTGQATDWLLASTLAAHERLILAGGLNPDNVGAALQMVCPWGVDVSSGVERDGVKDPDLISDFIRAVRRAQPVNPGYDRYREEPNLTW